MLKKAWKSYCKMEILIIHHSGWLTVCLCLAVIGCRSLSNLKQQLILREALDWFQQVRIQTQFVLQLLLTLLHKEDKLNHSCNCKSISLETNLQKCWKLQKHDEWITLNCCLKEKSQPNWLERRHNLKIVSTGPQSVVYSDSNIHTFENSLSGDTGKKNKF